jgi:hypothetical protein
MKNILYGGVTNEKNCFMLGFIIYDGFGGIM